MSDIPLVVGVLKVVMLLVMVGGGVAVFRELIPMARGRAATPPAPPVVDVEEQ